MKILLVNPYYPDSFLSYKRALKLMSKKSLLPPLGLLTVAAMLPGKWEKKLIDINVTRLDDEDILWADYVFVSAMHVQRDTVKEVIRKCNMLNRKVVAGGPLFTSSFDEFDGVSHFVLGEAESTLSPFLLDLTKDCAKPVYHSGEPPDIGKTPVPLWSLIKMKDYALMNMQVSRGCPFDCEFCDIVFLYGRKPRVKSAQQMISELEALYSQGWRGQIFVVDDNFIGNKKKIKSELLPAMIEWSRRKKFPFTFSTEATIDLADNEELIRLMLEAGFNIVFVGIETPNVDSLAECNKLPNTGRDLVASVKKIQNLGLEVQGGFMIGFDSDPVSIFDSQIDFIQKSGIVVAVVGMVIAFRGTRLYNRLKNEGRLVMETSGNTTSCSMNFIPKMSYETLINGYKHVADTIYSPSNYYERVHTFLKEYRPQVKRSTKLWFPFFTWFIRSIWFAGFAEKDRIYFWKLVISTLLRYPHFFWQAIRFSVFYLDFRKFALMLRDEPGDMQIRQLSAKRREPVKANGRLKSNGSAKQYSNISNGTSDIATNY